jgi:capsular polysaccharide transport system permease protein
MTDTQTHVKKLRSVSRHTRFATYRTIAALILREMSSTYGRSPGGYVWAVLEPALGIALLALVFSIGFRTPKLGDNFAIFYATGLLPFFFFNAISNTVAQSINYSRALLSYPRVTFIDAIIARLALGALTQLLVSFLLLAGIRMVWETRTVIEFDKIIMAYTMALALGLGVGLTNCFLFTMYPLWQRAWGIFTRPLFLVSGIILLFESVPEPYASYLWFNPVIHLVSENRAGFYLQYEATWVSYTYVFGVALVTALFGMVFLHRYHRDMLER